MNIKRQQRKAARLAQTQRAQALAARPFKEQIGEAVGEAISTVRKQLFSKRKEKKVIPLLKPHKLGGYKIPYGKKKRY